MTEKTEKNQELLNEVLLQTMRRKTLPEIARKPGMPDLKTLNRWLARNKVFRKIYCDASRTAANELILESVQIADRLKNSMKEVVTDGISAYARLDKAKALMRQAHEGNY